MDADTRLAEIAARQQDATKGTWGTYYDGTIYHLAADMRVDGSCSRQIGEIPDGDDKTQAFHDAMFIGRARDDIAFLLAQVNQLRKQLATVAEFAAKRAEYITSIENCSPSNDHDYWRWQGHAEARRQLSQQLGLPVGWPAKDGSPLASTSPSQVPGRP